MAPTTRRTRRLAKDAELRMVRALDARRRDLWNSGRQEVLIELPQPIRWGWERYFYIRPELARTTEGPALQAVLNLTQNVEWSNRRDFAARDWEHGGKKRPMPHRLREIPEAKFWDDVPTDLRRYFEPVTHREKLRCRHTQVALVRVTFAVKNPDARFASRLRPYYMTHRALPASEADSELANVEARLYGPTDWGYRHLVRWRGEFKDYDPKEVVTPLVEPDDTAGLPARIATALSRT